MLVPNVENMKFTQVFSIAVSLHYCDFYSLAVLLRHPSFYTAPYPST